MILYNVERANRNNWEFRHLFVLYRCRNFARNKFRLVWSSLTLAPSGLRFNCCLASCHKRRLIFKSRQLVAVKILSVLAYRYWIPIVGTCKIFVPHVTFRCCICCAPGLNFSGVSFSAPFLFQPPETDRAGATYRKCGMCLEQMHSVQSHVCVFSKI